jgi:hypothetical protein
LVRSCGGLGKYSLSSSGQGTEHFKRAQAGSGSRFNAERYEDFENVLFHCRFAIAKNRCDLTICFTLGEPQGFCDARVAECFQRSGRVEEGLSDGLLTARRDASGWRQRDRFASVVTNHRVRSGTAFRLSR